MIALYQKNLFNSVPGIAFDQGKTLPTPETVPFRLTQDIVAGFGSSGVEGTSTMEDTITFFILQI